MTPLEFMTDFKNIKLSTFIFPVVYISVAADAFTNKNIFIVVIQK